MVLMKCPNCQKEFKSKNGYNYHMNKKIPCKKVEIIENNEPLKPTEEPIIDETKYKIVENDDGRFVCPECQNTYKNKISCQKHIKYCHSGYVVPNIKIDDANIEEKHEEVNIKKVVNKSIQFLYPNYLDFNEIMQYLNQKLTEQTFIDALTDKCSLLFHPELRRIVMIGEDDDDIQIF